MEKITTLKDCAKCEVLKFCDAHISYGEWKHHKGIEPCKIILGD